MRKGSFHSATQRCREKCGRGARKKIALRPFHTSQNDYLCIVKQQEDGTPPSCVRNNMSDFREREDFLLKNVPAEGAKVENEGLQTVLITHKCGCTVRKFTAGEGSISFCEGHEGQYLRQRSPRVTKSACEVLELPKASMQANNEPTAIESRENGFDCEVHRILNNGKELFRGHPMSIKVIFNNVIGKNIKGEAYGKYLAFAKTNGGLENGSIEIVDENGNVLSSANVKSKFLA